MISSLTRRDTDCCHGILNTFYLSMKTLPILNMNTDLNIVEVKLNLPTNCYTKCITFLHEFSSVFNGFWWTFAEFLMDFGIYNVIVSAHFGTVTQCSVDPTVPVLFTANLLKPLGTSVDVERLFSTAFYILNKDRNCLLPKNSNKLFFLHGNLMNVNYQYWLRKNKSLH